VDPHRARILDIATRILNREISPILGCRAIASELLHFDQSVRDQDVFLVIRGLDSESDGFPIDEDERRTWAKSALERLDRERSAFEAGNQPTLDEACREILAIWQRGPD
jgi:hypothetical protein